MAEEGFVEFDWLGLQGVRMPAGPYGRVSRKTRVSASGVVAWRTLRVTAIWRLTARERVRSKYVLSAPLRGFEPHAEAEG